jgi:hypothetical protein
MASVKSGIDYGVTQLQLPLLSDALKECGILRVERPGAF